MNPNLTTTYMAIQTDRSRLAAQAERGWRAEQAGKSDSPRPAIRETRRWIGALLIVAGERLQGTRRGAQAPAT